MRQKFVSSLFLLLLVNFVVKPIWIFGIDLQVQNHLGASSYGLYAALFSLAVIFNMVLDLGLTQFSNRRVSQDPEMLQRHFSGLLSLKLLLGLVYGLLALGVGLTLGYRQGALSLLLILVLHQFLSSAVLFFRAHLAALQHFRADSLMSVLDKGLTIVFCGIFLYEEALRSYFTIHLFAGLQVLSLLLTALLGLVLVGRQGATIRLRWQARHWLEQLGQSWPYALLLLLMALYTRVDSVMLEQLISSFEAGVYAQAYRLLEAANQPAYLFSVLLLPLFASARPGTRSVRELSQLAFTLIVVGTVAFSVVALRLSPWIMDGLYREHSQLSSPVFGWLIFSTIGFGSTYVFGTLLTAQGRLRLLNYTALGGLSLNILANALLIPSYGAWGAAMATLATQGLTALVQLWLALKSNRFRYPFGYWLRLLLFLGIALGVWALSGQMSYLPPVALGLLMLMLQGLSAFLLGLLPWRKALHLLRPNGNAPARD